MNKVLRISTFLTAVSALLLSESQLRGDTDQAPEPFSRDEASGKTVMSHVEGYQIVLSRFYNAPVKDSEAPELTLFDPVLDEEVELSSFIGEKPVVLLFGSYGCDVLHEKIEGVRRCLEGFGEKADFVFVYIREAHSLESNLAAETPKVLTPVIADPKSLEDREVAARQWMREKEVSFRVLIDSMEDEAATRWAGWPVRAFVVDHQGTVVYSGKPGPWGFYPAPGQKADGFDRMRPHEERFNQESLFEFLEGYFGEAEPVDTD